MVSAKKSYEIFFNAARTFCSLFLRQLDDKPTFNFLKETKFEIIE